MSTDEMKPPLTTPGPLGAPPPEISGKRHGWLWLVLLCVLAAAGFGLWRLFPKAAGDLFTSRPPATQPTRAVPIVAARVRRGDLPIYLNGLGTVTALNTLTVHTRVDGELMTVNYLEGQIVHAGDLLAQLDPRPFEVQLAQAQGQLARDEAQLTNARADWKRYTEAGDAATQQQRDTAAALVAQLVGTIQTDQGQVDAAKLNLVYCRITSPLTGRIGLRLVDPGNIVHASDANGLAVITQVQPITVVFTLAEDYLTPMLKAMKEGRVLTVDANNRDGTVRLATGTLSAVDSQIDPTTANIRLKATFANQDQVLFPNQFVNARLLIDTRQGAVLVPAAAIQRRPQGSFVYVVKTVPKGDKNVDEVELRPITPGPAEGDVASIQENADPEQTVAAGEIVVTDGEDKLVPGSRVTVNWGDAAATRPAGGATTAPTNP